MTSCSSPRVRHHAGAGGSSTSQGVNAAGASTAPSEQSTAGEAAGEPATILSWCDAQPVIAEKCGRCHGDPPANGAPFALVTYADTQRLDGRDRPRHERMLGAIEMDYMPATFLKLEPAVEPLSEGERQLLLEWLTAGAPRGEGCPDTP